ALALKGERPVRCRQTRFSRYQFGSFFGLPLVGIALRDRALGNAVRGEDNGQLRPIFSARLLPAVAQFFGECFGEQRLIVPLLDKIDLEKKISVAHNRAAVKSNAGARILWRETDGDDALVALAREGLHYIADEGLPVAHTDEDRHLQSLRQLIGLQKSPAGEGRETDQRIAMTDLFDHRWRQGPSAGDIT